MCSVLPPGSTRPSRQSSTEPAAAAAAMAERGGSGAERPRDGATAAAGGSPRPAARGHRGSGSARGRAGAPTPCGERAARTGAPRPRGQHAGPAAGAAESRTGERLAAAIPEQLEAAKAQEAGWGGAGRAAGG